jgi:hypothetical protein
MADKRRGYKFALLAVVEELGPRPKINIEHEWNQIILR